MIRAVIADDEPLARARVRDLLGERADVEIVGEARDGEEAVRVIHETSPDLLLLDIRMPGLDGFEVLAQLDARTTPAVVFVTAFDDYAVRAFEVRAIDYLVKPFHRARFSEAIDRAMTRPKTDFRELVAELLPNRAYLSRFVVRSAEEIYFVRAQDVMWIESDGNYVRLHAGGAAHSVRTSLRELEARLDPAVFVRVHRSAVINLDCVQKLEPYFHGEFVITLRDGTRLSSSRRYSPRLRELLKD